MPLPTDAALYLIGIPVVFVIALGKSAFGGGLAILGVPLLALVMPATDSAVVVAPLVVGMDLVTMGTMRRGQYSWPDLVWLLPGLVGGIALGAFVFVKVDETLVGLAIAIITLGFCGHYFLKGRLGIGTPQPPSPVKAILASLASGFTTFVAHAGGPPMAMYLLARHLPKETYVGTTVLVFALGNLLKLVPYGAIALSRPQTLWTALALSPVIPIGVWAGRLMLHRLSQRHLMNACYFLLTIAATHMLVTAVVRLNAAN